MDAATEIGLAVIATSMTLVAVFLPTAMMSGIPGLIFKQFGWTAVVAVLASLDGRAPDHADARRAIPDAPRRRAGEEPRARLVRRRRGVVAATSSLSSWSHRRCSSSVRSRWSTLLPTSFMSASDRSQTTLSIEIAPGSTLDETRRTVDQVLAITRTIPEIRQVFTSIGAGGGGMGMSRQGSGGSGPADLRKASLTINLVPRRDRSRSQTDDRKRTASETARRCRARASRSAPAARAKSCSWCCPATTSTSCSARANDVAHDLRGIHGLGNVTSTASLLRPEILITPDFARAAELGVTASSIGETVHVATAGDYDQALPKLNLPDRQIDIRVQLPLEARRDLATIEQMRVPGHDGLVPLSSVAQRDDRQRPGADRPLRPQPQHQHRSRTRRPAARRHPTPGRPTAGDRQPARRHPQDRFRRRRTHEGTVRQLRPRDGDGHPVRLPRAGSAVQGFPAADHDSRGAAAIGGRRVPRAAVVSSVHVDAGDDRAADADGHHHEELDPAGRIRDRRDARPRHGA